MMKPIKKYVLFLLVYCLSQLTGYGQEMSSGQQEVTLFKFVVGNDMFYIPWNGNGSELERLYTLIETYRTEITSGSMPVYVDGYCAAAGDTQAALALAKVRSNRVKSELIVHKGLREDHFVTKNHAGAYQGHKNVVVVTLRIPAPKEEPQPEPQSQPVPEQVITPYPVEVPQPDTVVYTVPAGRQADFPRFAIRTNLLYDAFLTPTLGVEWRPDRRVGIKLDGSFAHWGNEHGRVQKMWLVSPELRWYVLDNQPFYVGLGANVGEANIYCGFAKILSKDTGYQGNFYGGGVTVGYQLPLSTHFAIDFNLGLGYTRFSYDTFYLSNDVRVYKGRDLTKNFWGPTQGGISLVWKPLPASPKGRRY